MNSEQKRKARLIGWLVIAVLFTVGCVAYTLYTYSQAMLQTIELGLEP